LTPEAAHGPFRPGDRQADEQQGNKVGNEKGSAVIFGGKAGEAEEVAEADGAAGDGEDDTEGGAPAVSFGVRHGWILSREAVLGEAFLGKMGDGGFVNVNVKVNGSSLNGCSMKREEALLFPDDDEFAD
jgi:hypothetical protein